MSANDNVVVRDEALHCSEVDMAADSNRSSASDDRPMAVVERYLDEQLRRLVDADRLPAPVVTVERDAVDPSLLHVQVAPPAEFILMSPDTALAGCNCKSASNGQRAVDVTCLHHGLIR